MQIWVNDQAQQCPPALTISQLLQQLAAQPGVLAPQLQRSLSDDSAITGLAIAHNQQVLSREQWPCTSLQQGDRITLFTLVAGG